MEIAGIIHTRNERKDYKRKENMQFGRRWTAASPGLASSRLERDIAATRFGIPLDICEQRAGL